MGMPRAHAVPRILLPTRCSDRPLENQGPTVPHSQPAAPSGHCDASCPPHTGLIRWLPAPPCIPLPSSPSPRTLLYCPHVPASPSGTSSFFPRTLLAVWFDHGGNIWPAHLARPHSPAPQSSVLGAQVASERGRVALNLSHHGTSTAKPLCHSGLERAGQDTSVWIALQAPWVPFIPQ